MIITKKALPRRTFLKGVQATLALPLLDAMIPAMTALAQTPAQAVRRLGYVFVPMGCDHARWTPEGQGALGQLTPCLSPLAPIKDQLTVVTNMELQNSYPGTHDTSNSGFLSAAFAKHTESSDYHLGTTADQLAAQQIGQETQLRSLELSMDLNPLAGVCNNGYACVYQNNLSWASPTSPLPTEADPRVVFERLFGDGGTPAQRRAEMHKNASILDWVLDDMARLQHRLGTSDRTRVDEYLSTVREVERRIQLAEQQTTSSPLPDLTRPTSVPAAWEDHVKLMFDLQILAFQADLTRVVTFQLAREASTRTYPQIGVPEPHHPISHHVNDPEKLAKLAKINAYHVSLFAYMVDKLKSTEDGDGSLLDHTTYMLGSGMGNPDVHDHRNLPIIVARGGGDKKWGGRHVKYDKLTPLANLHLALLDDVGVHLDRFVDSTGHADEVMEPLTL